MTNRQLEQIKEMVKETISAAIDLNMNESKEALIDINIRPKLNCVIFEYYSKGKEKKLSP